MSELKKCPICHEQAKIGYACGDYFAHCSDGCQSPMCDHASESTTVCSWNDWAAWYEKNRRAQPEIICPLLSDAEVKQPCIEGPCPATLLTNADRIRAMSAEELEDGIRKIGFGYKPWCALGCVDNCNRCLLDWLQQPSETEGTE